MPAIWLPACALNHAGADGTESPAPGLPLQGSLLAPVLGLPGETAAEYDSNPRRCPQLEFASDGPFEVLFWKRDLDPDPRVKRCSRPQHGKPRDLSLSPRPTAAPNTLALPHTHIIFLPETHLQWAPIATLPRPIYDWGPRDSIRKCGAKGAQGQLPVAATDQGGTTGRGGSPDRDASSSRAKASHLHPFGRASGQKRWATRRGPEQVASRDWLAS